MKSLRSVLSAAALAAVPASALLVSMPAAAEHRAVVAQETGYRYYRDQTPPQIVDVTPDQGERVDDRRRTRIVARFEDQGSGVQAAWLRIDGRDVTSYARFDGDRIRYREDLAPGRHVAEVIVRDNAGNVSRRAWSFRVVDAERYDRWNRDDRHGYYGQPQPYRW